MLSIRHLTKRFGGLVALNNLSLDVHANQFLGVIGPNGAGKTTLLNVVTGYLRPSAGSLLFEGREISRLAPYDICRLGLGRTFQVVQPLAEMTTLENAMVGAFYSKDPPASVPQARARAEEALELVGLTSRANVPAGLLTLGNKKKLELARALATRPRLLLLDEVMAGSPQSDVLELVDVLRTIHRSGTTILMIEHLVPVILELAEHVFVLNFGEELYQGRPEDVVAHPEVIESYLGKPLAAIAHE